MDKADNPLFSAKKSLFPKVKNGIWERYAFMTLGLSKIYKHFAQKRIKHILMPHENQPPPKALVERKHHFTSEYPEQNLEGFLDTADQASINCFCHFFSPDQKAAFMKKMGEGQKWLLFLNGSGEFYERKFREAKLFSDAIEGNYLLFNYRSVGESRGFFDKPRHLILDAEVCLQFLLEQGVLPENIVLIGRSLGGGIAAQLLSKYDDTRMVSINSFSRLSDMPIGLHHPFGWPIKKLMIFYGWEYDTVKALEKVSHERFLVVYNKNDTIIPYKHSSLAFHLSRERKHISYIPLKTQASPPHPKKKAPLIFYSTNEEFLEHLEKWQQRHFTDEILSAYWSFFTHMEESKGKSIHEIEQAFEQLKKETLFTSPDAGAAFIKKTLQEKEGNHLSDALETLIKKTKAAFLETGNRIILEWEKAPKTPVKGYLNPHSIPAARDPKGLKQILHWLKKSL